MRLDEKNEMQLKKRLFRETIYSNERLILSFIFLFTIVNWLLLTLVEKIGPPDFYKMYVTAEKLYSGDLNIGIIPPLFPLLLYTMGKLTGLFVEHKAAFIIAGRIISLTAGLGVLYITYLFLKKIVGKFAVLGIVFLAVSPWYLKLLSFPISNMLYLFFVTATFYAFLNKSSLWKPILSILGGVLTRFEGVLLILSAFLNYFKFKKRYFYILLAFVPLMLGLLLFFQTFTSRFFAHFKDIILPQKTYLYIFLHPLEFLNIIYGNILFFIPFSYPYFLKLILWIVILGFFFYGIYRLFKIERNLTIAIIVYEILFLMFKGYIDIARPDIEFRRIFSCLWIFYLISFIGCYFFLKKINKYKILKNITLISSGILLIFLSVSLEIIKLPLLSLTILILLPVLFSLRDLSLRGIRKYMVLFILMVFITQIYYSSYSKSQNYVVSMAHKAAYAAAQWLNFAHIKQGATVLIYTNETMINYYLKEPSYVPQKFQLIHFTIPLRNTTENRKRFIGAFFKALKEHNVDYIIFDNYVVGKPEFQGYNDAQRLLYEEKENPQYFRIRKYLIYKGKNVGYVLKPVYDKTNH